MSRVITITVPPLQTDTILREVEMLEGLIELHVQKGISVRPSGDLITVQITNRSLHELMRRLRKHGLGQPGGVSLTTSDPDSMISSGSNNKIDRDEQESTWEEMEMIFSKDSNPTLNMLGSMAVAGILATVGIATNALHLVIGGMLVAPGFMPIMRISLGIVTQNRKWHYGIIDTCKGYLVLLTGAAFTAMILKAIGKDALQGYISYYDTYQTLTSYWTTITPSSIMASAAAALAGGFLIASKKSVFTSGVMIGLALVPSAALVAIALVSWNTEIAGQAALRWMVDVGLVLVISILIFWWKEIEIHKRKMK